MLITELFDKKIKYKITKDTHEDFYTSAEIGGRVINFAAEYRDWADEWLIKFEEIKRDGGSGSELEVFTMITDSITELIRKHKPSLIRFSAVTEKGNANRAKLYHRLILRFNVDGYELISKKSDESESFRLVKKNNR